MMLKLKKNNMSLKLDRVIYSDTEKQDGLFIHFFERDNDYKLIIKRVRNDKIIGGALYYESLPKYKSFMNYFRFVVATIEDNIDKVENLYFWEFNQSIFKYLLQRRS